MEDFLALIQANGLLGLGIGLAVLVAVLALSKTGVVVTGDQKRIANVVLAILLSGLNLLNPQDPQAVVAVIASIGSALMYEVIKWAGGRFVKS